MFPLLSSGRAQICTCHLKVVFILGTFMNVHGFQLYLYIALCFTSEIYNKVPNTVMGVFLFYYWLIILILFWHSLNINYSHL